MRINSGGSKELIVEDDSTVAWRWRAKCAIESRLEKEFAGESEKGESWSAGKIELQVESSGRP